MNTKVESKTQSQLDNIAEQWVFLCIQQIQAKERLKGNKENGKAKKD